LGGFRDYLTQRTTVKNGNAKNQLYLLQDFFVSRGIRDIPACGEGETMNQIRGTVS
jgi:hypothetical protein